MQYAMSDKRVTEVLPKIYVATIISRHNITAIEFLWKDGLVDRTIHHNGKF